VEVPGEQEFHTGPVELGDLIQQAHIDLRHFVDPEVVA
jgi:hypothetical protein